MIILNGIPWESCNIGNLNPETSIIELVETTKEVISKKLIYHLIDYPDGYPQDEPMRRSPNISEAQIQLGFKSRIKFNIGLLKFLAWSKDVYSAD